MGKVTCGSCKKSLSGEALKVQDKYYHIKCFKCKACKKSLADKGYFNKDGKFYCPDDYQLKYGKKCAKCSKFVEGEVVTVLSKPYHQHCLTCSTCKNPCVTGTRVTVEADGTVVCHNCNPPLQPQVVPLVAAVPPPTLDLNVSTANGLSTSLDESRDVNGSGHGVVGRGMRGMRGSRDGVEVEQAHVLAATAPVHTPTTTTTSQSHQEISEMFINLTDESNNTISLLDGYDDDIDCSGCGKSLHGKSAVLALDKKWHVDCFTCKHCAQVLPGEYMGKDGWPYCEKDYQVLFGVKCVACNDYITGKVLQAGDKHFHPECSRCAKCNMMFGEGEEMYLQGTDIWHPACTEVVDGDTSQQSSYLMLTSMPQSSQHSLDSRLSSQMRRFKYAVPYTPDRYEPKYDPDFSGEIYIASYLPLPERFDGYMRMPLSPKPPRSPHFHRPTGLFSYKQNKQRFLVNPHRPGMQSVIDMMDSVEARVKSPHMNNAEPLELAHFPNGRPPSPGEKAPIEREDFPAPPYRPFGPLKWHRGGDEGEEVEEEAFKKEKELLRREEKQLEKLEKSGVGDIMLREIKKDIKRAEHRMLDPRNASRSASGKKEPHLPTRYESPIFASPSRHLNRPMPWRKYPGVIDRYGTYRSYMGIIPTHAVPKPGYGLTPKSATLPGDGRMGPEVHDISFDSMNSTRSSDYRTTTSMDSSASYPNGLPPNVYFASHRHYQKYPHAVHHRRSLPNVSSEPPKVFPYDKIKTTNYKLPDDADATHLERHLELSEFKDLFKMTPIEFYKLPLWKRNELKKAKKLF